MGLFTKSVMGISASKVPEMKEAITNYVSGIQDIIKRVEDKEASAGFKGEYAIAISNYVTSVKLVCTKIVAELKLFSDKLDLIKAAYEASDTKLAEALASGKGSLLSNFNVEDAAGSLAVGGAAAAMAAGVNASTPAPVESNVTPTPDYSVAQENVKQVFQQAASHAQTALGALNQAASPGTSQTSSPKNDAQASAQGANATQTQNNESTTPVSAAPKVDSQPTTTTPSTPSEKPAEAPVTKPVEQPKDNVVEEGTSEPVSDDPKDTVTESSNDKPSSSEASSNSSSKNLNGVSMAVPDGDTSYKSYTSYRKVNSKTPQGAVVYGGTAPYGKYEGTTYNTQTDPDTGVRYVTLEGDDTKYYCAAMGTYYGEVGDTFKITTDEGNSYNVIMCDVKGSDAQGWRDGETWFHESNGKRCVTEFYVDTNQIPDEMKVSGGTTGTYDSVSQFSGEVVKVEKLS